MKEKLVKIWGTLRPEQRKKSIIAGVLLVLTVVAFGIYKSTRGSAPPPAAFRQEGDQPRRGGQGRPRKVPLQRVDEGHRRHEDPDGGPPEAAQGGPETKRKRRRCLSPIPAPGKSCAGCSPGEGQGASAGTRSPRRPMPAPAEPRRPHGASASRRAAVAGAAARNARGRPGRLQPPNPRSTEASRSSPKRDDAKSEAKKKDGMKIYLPPSFMEGTLLSGMYAPANEWREGRTPSRAHTDQEPRDPAELREGGPEGVLRHRRGPRVAV